MELKVHVGDLIRRVEALKTKDANDGAGTENNNGSPSNIK